MVKFYHYFLSLIGVSIAAKYLINKHLQTLDLVNPDGSKKPLPMSTMIFILLECIFYSFTKLKYVFLMGFRNLIVDEELGSTSMTLITSTWFLSLAIPNTIGLWLVEVMNYDFFMMIGLTGVTWGLCASWKTAIWLDSVDPENFKLFGKKDDRDYREVMAFEKIDEEEGI
jgi:hypothetical protein